MPERATVMNRSEKSAEVVVAGGMAYHRPEPKAKDRRIGRIGPLVIAKE